MTSCEQSRLKVRVLGSLRAEDRGAFREAGSFVVIALDAAKKLARMVLSQFLKLQLMGRITLEENVTGRDNSDC
jgi:hypothetical protein